MKVKGRKVGTGGEFVQGKWFGQMIMNIVDYLIDSPFVNVVKLTHRLILPDVMHMRFYFFLNTNWRTQCMNAICIRFSDNLAKRIHS